MTTSRRDFLKYLALLAAAGVTGTFSLSGNRIWAAESQSTYSVLPWTGDDFTRGHALRDGNLPAFPDKADEHADFVIVGGGMAGLACAYFLRDKDFLLMEQYSHTGGTSSGGTYKGIDYSMGAVCTGPHSGMIAQLLTELELKPVVIPPEQTQWHCGGQWYKSVTGSDKFHSELTRSMKETDKFFANKPAQEKVFSKMLSGYSADFLGLLNNTAKSFYTAGIDDISAGAGFGMIKVLTTDSYVFDGGNSGIARALRSALDKTAEKRIRPSCFVWSVKPNGKGVSVVYTDAAGRARRVDCKHAVLAVPPMVAIRIAPDLPVAMKTKSKKLEYGAMVVGNFCMKKKVLDLPYQSFADDPFAFGQMVLAEAPYEASGRYRPEMGSVLTVYHPFEHGPPGRVKLLSLAKENLAESIVTKLSELLKPIAGELDEIVLTRWGHAGSVPYPGVAKLLQSLDYKPLPWVTFAHSSSTGGQSFEGAVTAARHAADRCLALL